MAFASGQATPCSVTVSGIPDANFIPCIRQFQHQNVTVNYNLGSDVIQFNLLPNVTYQASYCTGYSVVASAPTDQGYFGFAASYNYQQYCANAYDVASPNALTMSFSQPGFIKTISTSIVPCIQSSLSMYPGYTTYASASTGGVDGGTVTFTMLENPTDQTLASANQYCCKCGSTNAPATPAPPPAA